MSRSSLEQRPWRPGDSAPIRLVWLVRFESLQVHNPRHLHNLCIERSRAHSRVLRIEFGLEFGNPSPVCQMPLPE